MLDFGWIAKQSTSRAPILKGLLPTFSTLITLLMISGALATGMWIWAGATATLMSFVPVFAKSFAAIAGTALLNFWFNRDITTAVLNSREVRKGFKFDEHNPTDLQKLVNHVRLELNAHFRTIYGDSHVDLPMPRLCIYTSDKAKVHANLGRTQDNIALFFSSTLFDSHNTRWTQRDLAALVAFELTKAYKQRGWSATISSIATSFLFTLESLQQSEHWYYRALGMLAGPLQFFFLVQKAIDRSYAYEAATTMVDIGRGMDYYWAIDTKVCPSLRKQYAPAYMSLDQARKKREPYNGWFASVLRPFTDRIDSAEWIEDITDKQGSRIVSAIDIMVRETIFSLQELKNSDPRTTRLKDHLRDLMPIGRIARLLPDQAIIKNPALLENKLNWTVQVFLDNLLAESMIDEVSAENIRATFCERANIPTAELAIYLNRPLNFLSAPQLEKLFKMVCEEEIKTLDRRDRVVNQNLFNQIPEQSRYQSIGPDGNGVKASYDHNQTRDIDALRAELAALRLAVNDQNHHENNNDGDDAPPPAPAVIIHQGPVPEQATVQPEPATQPRRRSPRRTNQNP